MAPGERTPFGPLSLWPLRPDFCIGSNAESLQSTRGDACPCDLHGGLCDPASDCRTLDVRRLGWQWCSTLPGAFHTIDGGLRATVPHCRLMLAISLTERGHSRRAARSDELMMFMPHNPCREIRLEPALGHRNGRGKPELPVATAGTLMPSVAHCGDVENWEVNGVHSMPPPAPHVYVSPVILHTQRIGSRDNQLSADRVLCLGS